MGREETDWENVVTEHVYKRTCAQNTYRTIHKTSSLNNGTGTGLDISSKTLYRLLYHPSRCTVSPVSRGMQIPTTVRDCLTPTNTATIQKAEDRGHLHGSVA